MWKLSANSFTWDRISRWLNPLCTTSRDKPSGGCKELGLDQRGGTDDLGTPCPPPGVFSSTDKKLPGSIRCNKEWGSVRPDTHESRSTRGQVQEESVTTAAY